VLGLVVLFAYLRAAFEMSATWAFGLFLWLSCTPILMGIAAPAEDR
jgi:hypothetical protein